MAALHGVDSDSGHATSGQATARSFRTDKNNSVADRFEVALLAERTASRSALGGHVHSYNAAELERIADKLRQEFGDIPEVFNFYASVARGADMARARALAVKILDWPANPEAKAEAQAILSRHTLLGKPLAVKLTTTEGATLDLAQPTGKLTLIYLWPSKGDGKGMSPLVRHKKTLPADAQVVYVALGATVEQAQVNRAAAPIPGVHCFEGESVFGPALRALQLRQLPYVLLIDRTGALAGFGPVAEIGSLIAAANR